MIDNTIYPVNDQQASYSHYFLLGLPPSQNPGIAHSPSTSRAGRVTPKRISSAAARRTTSGVSSVESPDFVFFLDAVSVEEAPQDSLEIWKLEG